MTQAYSAPVRMALYPIALCNLENQRVVVIGGGVVATRKVRGLLAVQAQVVVVSPTASDDIRGWATAGQLTWHPRPFAPADLAGALLVFAATNDRVVNAQVTAVAQAQNSLCNVADVAEEGDFVCPAVIRHDELVIGINTTQKNPRRAVQVRQEVQQWLQQS